MYILGVRC